METQEHNKLDIALRLLSLVAAFVAFCIGLSQYQDTKEQSFKQPFYQQQLKVINEIYDVMADIESAKNESELNTYINRFWMLYGIKGRTFLDAKLLEELKWSAEYIKYCVGKSSPPAESDCQLRGTLRLSGFSKVAREQLSKYWDMSFEEIRDSDPYLTNRK